MRIYLNAEQAATVRRDAFERMQSLQLEIDRHKAKFPGYLQDQVYLTQVTNQRNNYQQIANAVDLSIEHAAKEKEAAK